MKNINPLFILLAVIPFLLINCGSSGTYDNYKEWKHFSISARSSDDPMFVTMQREFGIDPPLESFYLEVDLTNPEYEFAKIGKGEGSRKILWEQLSPKVRKFLINWEYYKENLSQ